MYISPLQRNVGPSLGSALTHCMLGLTNTADVFCKKGVRGYVSKTALNAKEACLKDTALEDWALGSWSRSIYEYAEYQLYGYYYG